jgi:tetratricopeptide (TPR) repeat protein/glycosyltransferase involved in cell wall biosynthesis
VAPILHWRTTVPRLSVCLIVKNEERHLPRCLESVAGLADEIVVVDTGSTDRTSEIAREHGARVAHFEWRDDFSAAKNFSIEQATGDWILSIDADEAIATRDHRLIRAIVDADAVDAVVVAHRHYVSGDTVLVGWQPGAGGYAEGESYRGFVDEDCRRLFRNRPWLRFRNRVHEELVSLDKGRPLVESRGTWVLHHYGKSDGVERLRGKGEAYLRIGRTKVDEHPRDPQVHYELGVQYAELHQPVEAIGCFEQALALSPHFRDAQFRLALCLLEAKQYRAALQALRNCHRLVPRQRAEICLSEGNAHRELGDLIRAEQAFRRALKENPAFTPASSNLALLYTRARRYDEALACLDRAVERATNDIQLRSLRGHVRCDAGDEEAALEDLERASGDTRALRLRVRILVRQRRFDEARDCLMGIDTGADAELSALVGAVSLGRGNVDEAIAHLRESLRIAPTVDAALNLSTALQSQGATTEAFRAAAQALGIAPSSDIAQTRFGQFAGQQFHERRDAESRILTFGFYQPYSLDYDGSTPRERGLGGTESAVVYLTESLARRGHRCIVFNGCGQEHEVAGVEYARWESMPVRCVADRPDVLVAVRSWDTIGRLRLAPLQIFWTGDAFDQPFVQTLSNRAARGEIDFFMLQSDWHAATFQTHHAVPIAQTIKTTLGAAASARPTARPSIGVSRPRRLAYVSTPFRGLDVLLDLFPRIRQACPDAELHVFSSMRVYGVSAADDQAQFEALYRKARELEGVTLVGSLPQTELAERLEHCRVLAYPNHFEETFCIAAAEAQAAGCPVVTSALGALPETVGDAGLCIAGDPRSVSYQNAFIAECIDLLMNDTRWQAVSDRARARAGRQFSWPTIAAHWESVCRSSLLPEPPEMERIAVHLANDRAGLAQRMLTRTTRPDDVPCEAWEALKAFVAWREGAAPRPAPATLQQIALHFRSLRRYGVLDDLHAPRTRIA